MNYMYENSHSWRRRLRLQELVKIARDELQLGKEFDEISLKLENQMQTKWKLTASTRRQYLLVIEKVLDNQFVIVH